jgi:ABC-2 type transport system permease protein
MGAELSDLPVNAPGFIPAHVPSMGLLLRPRIQGLLNSWKRSDTSRKLIIAFFIGVTLAFWAGLFAVCIYFLDSFSRVELFGPLLLRKALSMLLLSFSGLLFFSNIISALSSYFLSEDMQLIQSLPIEPRRVFYYRLIDTLFASSWMMMFFGIPVLLAYGIVQGGGITYYLVATFGLMAYLLPPAALGVVVACLLVRGFSASRTRELMVLVSMAFLIGMLLLLRALRPERLVDPEAFQTLAEFIAVVRAPDSSWLPSTWLTELCMWSLGGRVENVGLTFGLLFLAGPALIPLARWLVAPIWFDAWTNAQEAPKKVASRNKFLTRAIDGVTFWLPGVYRPMLRKDLRLFFREPGQWTQAILLMGLVAVYLYSVHALPLDVVPLKRGVLQNAIAFLNVGVAGAVLSALAVRFHFTAVSQEGRAFWVLHASPIGARRFLFAKFLMGWWPTILFGEVLVVSTNAMLNVDPLYGWLAAGTIAMLSIGLTGLAVGLGALYPDFKADNAARMASGPGAILFMVLSLTFTAGVIVVEAVPVGMLLANDFRETPVSPQLMAGLVAAGVVVVVANLLAAWIPITRGATKLWGDLGNVGD